VSSGRNSLAKPSSATSTLVLLWGKIKQNWGCHIARVCGFDREGASLSMPLLFPGEIPANLIPAKIMERKEGDDEIKKEGNDTRRSEWS